MVAAASVGVSVKSLSQKAGSIHMGKSMQNVVNPAAANPLGLLSGIMAFLCWGFLVLFWNLLGAVPAFEILCYRILFSFVFLLPIVLATRRWPEIIAAVRNRKVLLTMLASSCIVAINWFLYIWAVSTGQILETSLGYYTNPLMNVLFGLLFLRERPTRLQAVAILLAAFGVLLSFIGHSHFPWLALSLAASFALYGFIRKTVSVEALPGLFIETVILTPFTLGWVLWMYAHGQGFLNHPTVFEGVLLVLAGPVTSLPLVMFAYAARHMQLMTLGLLQYISPTCTFFLGLFVFGEQLNAATLVIFVFIWLALGLYTFESWRLYRLMPRRTDGKA